VTRARYGIQTRHGRVVFHPSRLLPQARLKRKIPFWRLPRSPDAWTQLRATGDRIPSGFGPLDARALSRSLHPFLSKWFTVPSAMLAPLVADGERIEATLLRRPSKSSEPLAHWQTSSDRNLRALIEAAADRLVHRLDNAISISEECFWSSTPVEVLLRVLVFE
jgi:hypothetical protein